MWYSALPLLLSVGTAVLVPQHLLDYTRAQEADKTTGYMYGHQGTEEKSFCSWQCLLFTLQWPGAFCQSLDNGSLCQIPKRINTWTIHGLWPQRASDCCDCWPMFQSDVQDLEEELNKRWPSLLKIRSSYHFWKEEWKKHGVCAACVEGMNSPQRYFQLCLKLRQQFEIKKLLENAGIIPSCDRPYKVAEIHQVLDQYLGEKYEIQCINDSKDRQLWFQLKIRLSRNLTLGCDPHGDAEEDPESRSSPGWRRTLPGHPCPPHIPFYYLPIDHEHPESPCN